MRGISSILSRDSSPREGARPSESEATEREGEAGAGACARGVIIEG